MHTDLYTRVDQIIATVPESDVPYVLSIYYGMTRENVALSICGFQDRIDGLAENEFELTRDQLCEMRNRAIAYYNLGNRASDYFWMHGHELKTR